MKIGITEAGDAGLDFSWFSKLEKYNIIISKHVSIDNKKFLDLLLMKKNNIILHCTCTGYGGTLIEPNVPPIDKIKEGIIYLINNGFSKNHIVLRIDPIIPGYESYNELVLDSFIGIIPRVRFSIITMYTHVKRRFKEAGLEIPNITNTDKIFNLLETYKNHYDFESCATDVSKYNFINNIGCVSEKDLRILGYTGEVNNKLKGQRELCKCLSYKHELLSCRKRCNSQCLYCYWYD